MSLVSYQPEFLKQTFAGKRIFLTGHTGFKGSWLTAWLHRLGAEIYGYALAPEQPQALYHLIQGDELCHSTIADLRDSATLKKSFVQARPDFIFHLAAQPLVRASYQNPLETHEINIMGTAYLLDIIRQYQQPCTAVFITTDKVYHNEERHYAYQETDKLGGYDPYSASKAGCEIVIDSYRHSFFNPQHFQQHHVSLASARAGNVIGGGDWAMDRIIPDIIRSLANGESLQVRNPTAVRPWQHVLEPLGGYLLLAAQQQIDPFQHSQAYNFGPEKEDVREVQELVNIALQTFGQPVSMTPLPTTPQVHEAHLLMLDIQRAKEKLGWQPLLNSNQAIEWTMNWYKAFLKSQTNIIFDQIQVFEKLMSTAASRKMAL
jgi:CDP-glucose 4,6-dehydratase